MPLIVITLIASVALLQLGALSIKLKVLIFIAEVLALVAVTAVSSVGLLLWRRSRIAL